MPSNSRDHDLQVRAIMTWPGIYKKAIAIDEKALPEGNPKLAIDYNNLAEL